MGNWKNNNFKWRPEFEHHNQKQDFWKVSSLTGLCCCWSQLSERRMLVASFQTLKCLVLYSVTGQMLLPADLLSLLSTACDRILCIRKTPLSFQVHGEEASCLIIYLCLEMCAMEVCAMDAVPERFPKGSLWRWYRGYGSTRCEGGAADQTGKNGYKSFCIAALQMA